jgi:protein TonB
MRQRIAAGLGRRAVGVVAAVLVELLLLIALLTLGNGTQPGRPDGTALTTFDASNTPEAPTPQPDKQATPEQAQADPVPQPPQPQQVPQPPQPSNAPQPAPNPPALIPLTRSQLAGGDITRAPVPAPAAGPPAPPRQAYGPQNTGGPADTQRVGTAPNGQPLYAARWYREPTDAELAGYLSTATQGWGLIACRTAPDYRVEDCVAEGETPGSEMARAVLAAAWQFKVRPPRLGGQDRIGAWVRIRIDYSIKPH